MTSLYQISNLSIEGSFFRVTVTLNPAHLVFSGHFPGKPIVPGVVLVEIAAAAASLAKGKQLIVKEASVIKFLQVVDPKVNPVLSIEGSILSEEANFYKTDQVLSSGDVVFVKIKGLRLTGSD
jgi:3-hydroxyacyl-[acyl-carrier-protein] dehydratase